MRFGCDPCVRVCEFFSGALNQRDEFDDDLLLMMMIYNEHEAKSNIP